MSKIPEDLSRRSTLSTLGAAIAGLGGVGTVAGQERKGPTLYEEYQRALEIREKSGKKELFTKYLLNKGWALERRQKQERVNFGGEKGGSSSDGMSTQDLEQDELSATLDYYIKEDCYTGEVAHYVDYHSTIDPELSYSESDGHGENGPDDIAIAGHPDHYYVDENDWYDGGGSELYKKDTTWSGVNWELKDGEVAGSSSQSYTSYVGTKLTKKSTSQDRAVRAEYNHVYENENLIDFEVTADSTAPLIDFKGTTHYWEGGVIVMFESEARTDFCGGTT